MKPTVTIVTPMYNGAALIGETVRSVRAQTFEDWRWLIADDGSSDGSVEVATRAAEGDSRIEVLSSERTGHPSRIRNLALRRADSELVAFIDHDDLWRPEFLERQIHLAEQTGAAVVHTGATHLVDGHDVEVPPRFRGPRLVMPPEMLGLLMAGNPIYLSSVVARTAPLRQVGFFSEHEDHFFISDFDLWLRLGERFSFAYNSDKLLRYRISATSMTAIRVDHLVNARGRIAAIEASIERLPRLGSPLQERRRSGLGESQAAHAQALLGTKPPQIERSKEYFEAARRNGHGPPKVRIFRLLHALHPTAPVALFRFLEWRSRLLNAIDRRLSAWQRRARMRKAAS